VPFQSRCSIGGSSSALKFRGAEQESRQELILLFKCARGLLLVARPNCKRLCRSPEQRIVLGGLRLGVRGGLLIELGLWIRLSLIIELIQQGFARFFTQAAGYELRFKPLFF
jgi:hypothetical protein